MEKKIIDEYNDSLLEIGANAFGLTLNDLTFIGGFESHVYSYIREGIDYILRVTSSFHRSESEILSELDFILYLYKHGASVSMPVKALNGNYTTKIEAKSSYFTVSSFIKAKGERPKELVQNKVRLFNYGAAIGHLDRLTMDYSPSSGISRRLHFLEDPILCNAKSYLNESDYFLVDALNETIDEIEKIPKTKTNFGLIHGDIHLGNLLFEDDQIHIFDFDDASYHYYLSDIAIPFFGVSFMSYEKDALALSFYPTFLKGYYSKFDQPTDNLFYLNLFLRFRVILVYIALSRSLSETDPFRIKYQTMYRDFILNKTNYIEDVTIDQIIKEVY